MDPSPLVTEWIEAGARFLTEFDRYRPVQSAFWLKGSEEGHWWLYVASEQITDENFDVAYEEVIDVLDRLQECSFDVMRVKVIGANDRLAKAALELRRRYPGARPVRIFGEIFGGISVEEVYLYPSPVHALPHKGG
jgi:hypothetical protein